MDNSLPLHSKNVHKLFILINRSHAFMHCIAISFLIHYRTSFLFQDPKTVVTSVPWLLVFFSEILLFFAWLLGLAHRWRPISRTVFPERLPEDRKLPGLDVFICTADPNKEPTSEVMNTVLSAMALDYPAEKLHIYLSDDGGAAITLHGMKEAWKFAKWWLPFCRRHGIKTRCPKAYFSAADDMYDSTPEFIADREKIKEKYEKFKESTMRATANGCPEGMGNANSRDHSAAVEMINESEQEDYVEMPLVVYVSREKRPSYSHNFKAGALNVLLRVSGVVSNSPYILVLDCDTYSNDPTSARQAMCFHLDPKISSSLAFVQFPQLFHNINANDIYDSEIRNNFRLCLYGMDGLEGPCMCGSNLYVKREALYDRRNIHNVGDLRQLKNSFGTSNEFIKSLKPDYKPSSMRREGESSLLQEAKVLASCTYENSTKWGKEVGFLYDTVVEDYFTGLTMHCKSWKSVYLNPPRAQFLGSAATNLDDALTQCTRWMTGLVGVGISKFCPLLYGPPRMSFLQSMCYAELALFSLFQSFSLWCLATIPQLCLLSGVPLYPEVSNPCFFIFIFVFTSAIAIHLFEVLYTGASFRTMINEQRIWTIRAVTCFTYGSLDAIMKTLGLREASFLPTNKVEDDDQIKLYEMGKFDFQASTRLLAPLATLASLNMASFFVGIIRMIFAGDLDKYLLQVLLSFYILAINYPIIEGMIIRKDKGRIPPFRNKQLWNGHHARLDKTVFAALEFLCDWINAKQRFVPSKYTSEDASQVIK
ncbi:cellulose synthase, putative [Ricinus communis]|uniref:Cellulose synthase, putative n=1 Tax=Ricinus communis TaxID=3988 RepID=B9STK2_RICCO|nr:cellulose synthase, putative [Ricinus communis]